VRAVVWFLGGQVVAPIVKWLTVSKLGYRFMSDLGNKELVFDGSSPVREVELDGEGVGEFLVELMNIRVQALEGYVDAEAEAEAGSSEYAIVFARCLLDEAVELQEGMSQTIARGVISEDPPFLKSSFGGRTMSHTGIVLAAGMIAISLSCSKQVLDRIKLLAGADDIRSQVGVTWYEDPQVPESEGSVVGDLVWQCWTWQRISKRSITARGIELPSFWQEVDKARGDERDASKEQIKQIILNRYSDGRVLVGSIPTDGGSLVMGILI